MQNKLISHVIRIGYTGLHVYAIKKLQNKPIMWPNQLIKESSRLSSLRPSCTLMLFSNIAGCILQPICMKFSTQLLIIFLIPNKEQFYKSLVKTPSHLSSWVTWKLQTVQTLYCICVDLIFINIFFIAWWFFTKLLENDELTKLSIWHVVATRLAMPRFSKNVLQL